jgi:hypothetical protein
MPGTAPVLQTQLAATVAALLGEDYDAAVPKAGKPIDDVIVHWQPLFDSYNAAMGSSRSAKISRVLDWLPAALSVGMIAVESTSTMSADNTSRWLYPLWVRACWDRLVRRTGTNCTTSSVRQAT